MMRIQDVAPAKLNLYLHVLGRRADGYHELDSLVAFAACHDLVEIREAGAFRFEIDGPFAEALAAEDPERNLAVRAARALAEAVGRPLDVEIVLTKNLPVAGGIGGGSSDAAAVLRLLSMLWDLPQDHPALARVAPGLGADVPVCLHGRTAYFGGIGDRIDPAPVLPETWIVLVNPGISLPTKDVFAARTGAFGSVGRLERTPRDAQDLAELLRMRGNDLTEPALGLVPVVGEALAALDATPDCLLSRMSGSGATCFGLYRDAEAAMLAAHLIRRVRPGWWVQATALIAASQD